MRHSLVHLQTEFCPHTDCTLNQAYYTTVDVLAIDGEPEHDWTSATPLDQPRCPNGRCSSYNQLVDIYYPGARQGKYRKYFKKRRSVSFTFGFNANETRGCDANVLSDKVNIGVYCSWPRSGVPAEIVDKQCRFSLSAHLIPEEVYDGFDATYPIAPAGEKGFDSRAPEYIRNSEDLDEAADSLPDAAAHFFKVRVGGFDVLNVSVERTGDNLTWNDAFGRLGSNGQGLRGTVAMRRRSEGCPSHSEYSAAVNVTDLTIGVELPAFCTEPGDAGDYVIGVLADEEFGPFYRTLPEASDGKVGPDLQPMSIYAPRREQTAYGQYRIRVHHVAYFAGLMSEGEERGACISYGQWRSFYIDTSGEHDAVVEVSLSGQISSTYIRSGELPTLAPPAFDVASPPGTTLVTASPCDASQPTRWHFSLYLAPEAEATAQGLAPSEFSVTVRLRAANLSLAQPVLSSSAGGRGYACCGAMRLFRLPPISERDTLRVDVNVTSGRLHALLVKWGSCPSFSEDVSLMRGECTSFCHMNWLTTRGAYSGSLYSDSYSTLVVPHGHGDEPDKRRAGRWYLGVQAMPGEAAQFDLVATVEVPIYVPASKRCSRGTQFCAADSARQAWNQGGPPAPPPSIYAKKHATALARGEVGMRTAMAVEELIASDIAQRVVFITLMLLAFVFVRWFYRTWRVRHLMRYHLPHDRLDF